MLSLPASGPDAGWLKSGVFASGALCPERFSACNENDNSGLLLSSSRAENSVVFTIVHHLINFRTHNTQY